MQRAGTLQQVMAMMMFFLTADLVAKQ